MYRVQNTVTYNEIFQDQNYYQNGHNKRAQNVSESQDKSKNHNQSLSIGQRKNPSNGNESNKIPNQTQQ